MSQLRTLITTVSWEPHRGHGGALRFCDEAMDKSRDDSTRYDGALHGKSLRELALASASRDVL
jgi:hypothetical protein